MTEHDGDLDRFEQLLENSSLGTAGARRLRRRTSTRHLAAVRRIQQLRNQMAHSPSVEAARAAATELVEFLRELGYHGQAEHVLDTELVEFLRKLVYHGQAEHVPHEALPGSDATAVAKLAEATARATDYRWTPQSPERSVGATQSIEAYFTQKETKARLTLLLRREGLAKDDPQWWREIRGVYAELRQHIGATPVPNAPPPGEVEPGRLPILVVLFSYSAARIEALQSYFDDWLDREPGRLIKAAVDTPGGGRQIYDLAGSRGANADAQGDTNRNERTGHSS
ncbi:hypothetical protein [Micromonospora sp. CA-248212]|uniref:hypothetical protein n=1 Tax=Micromonospora sp. CA-248212 TaxID=3239961 RepID=UPI003D8BB59D